MFRPYNIYVVAPTFALPNDDTPHKPAFAPLAKLPAAKHQHSQQQWRGPWRRANIFTASAALRARFATEGGTSSIRA